MIVGTLQLELHFLSPQSLKEKRVILKSLVDRMRRSFNVSIAEIDGMDLWQASALAVAAVGSERKRINQTLDHVLDFMRRERNLEIAKQRMEFF